jgi:hypothetical protein
MTKPVKQPKVSRAPIYERIAAILESTRRHVSRTVNSTQVLANWLIGREMVEEEQQGKRRAEYRQQLIEDLAARLTAKFGKGYSALNLWWFRRFYLEYPRLTAGAFLYAVRKELAKPEERALALPEASSSPPTASGADWKPGMLHSSLSWTHYRALLKVEKLDARSFYEIEAIDNHWSTRELERQINSLLYKRLAQERPDHQSPSGMGSLFLMSPN